MSTKQEENKTKTLGWIVPVLSVLAIGGFELVIGFLPIIVIGFLIYTANKRKTMEENAGNTEYKYKASEMKQDLKRATASLKETATRAVNQYSDGVDQGKGKVDALESALNSLGGMLDGKQDQFFATRDYDGDAVKRSADMVGVGGETEEYARLTTELKDLLQAGIIDRAEYNDRLAEVGVRVRS